MADLTHISDLIKNYLSDDKTEEQIKNEEQRRKNILEKDFEKYIEKYSEKEEETPKKITKNIKLKTL